MFVCGSNRQATPLSCIQKLCTQLDSSNSIRAHEFFLPPTPAFLWSPEHGGSPETPRSPLCPCGDVATEEGCPQQGTELLPGPWPLTRPPLSVLRYLTGTGSLLGPETCAAAAGSQQGYTWQRGHPGRSPVALATCLYLPGHLLKTRSLSQCP